MKAKTTSATRRTRNRCDACHQSLKDVASAPVLHDDLWHGLADPAEKLLCAPCLFERAQQRLGRQLSLADLRPCAFNLLNRPSWFDLFSGLEPQDPALIEQWLGAKEEV